MNYMTYYIWSYSPIMVFGIMTVIIMIAILVVAVMCYNTLRNIQRRIEEEY